MRRILIVVLLCLSLTIARAQEEAPRQVKILVVLPPDTDRFNVMIYSKWDFGVATALVGVMTRAQHDEALLRRGDPLAEVLNQTLQGFERAPAMIRALRAEFRRRAKGADVFVLTVSQERDRYFRGKYFDDPLPAAGQDGYDYLLEIDETFAGLATLNLQQADLVSPSYNARYRLIDATSLKVLHRGSHLFRGPQSHPSASAIRDRAHFEEVWTSISSLMASAISGELNGQDHLHRMAASKGRGDEVPAIKGVISRYAKMFRWNLQPVKGWRRYPHNSKFATVLGPKNAVLNQKMGLRFEMEPLVPEFGTDVRSLGEYLPVLHRNWMLNNSGATPLVKFEDIDAPGYEALVSDLPNGSKNILLVRKLNDSFVQIVVIVFASDFETLYPANRRDIERMIWQSRPKLLRVR